MGSREAARLTGGTALHRQGSELCDRFDRLRRDHPSRPLVFKATTGDVLTAEGLESLASVLRGFLTRTGVAHGNPVVSVCGNTATGIALFLACRRLDVPLLPVDRGGTPLEVLSLADRFGARLIVSGPLASNGAVSVTALTDGLSLIERPEPAANPSAVRRGVAVMKLTSGSTGLPRATLTTEASLVADADSIMQAMGIRPDDVQLAAIPLSHAYGIGNLVLPLLLQGTAVVIRDGFVPHQIAHDGAVHGITMFPGVPFMFDHLLENLPADRWPRVLKRLITAGAGIEPDTVTRFHDKFGLKIHSFYGTSETGGICYDDSPEVDAEPTVGCPLPDVTVRLMPEEGAPAGGGRVHVAGPAVAAGYASGPDSPDGGSPFVRGGFLTGDLGRFDARNRLELLGRVSSFVNVAGRKVQPQEVEGVIRAMTGVIDVRVLGAPDTLRGQQLVACVVCAPGTTAASVRAHCAARLAPFKIPRQVVFLGSIPLTERGKTDRAQLEAIVTGHLAAMR